VKRKKEKKRQKRKDRKNKYLHLDVGKANQQDPSNGDGAKEESQSSSQDGI
jgi:hypothetical protein